MNIKIKYKNFFILSHLLSYIRGVTMAKRVIKRGNVLYEMDRFGNPIRIKTEADMRIKYESSKQQEKENKKRFGENSPEYEELEYYNAMTAEPEQHLSPEEKRKKLLKMAGNSKKLVTFADGLDKEISIVDRKKKRKSKNIPKRKPNKKRRCKK